MGFHGCSDSKESAYNAGDPGSIPRSERSPGEGNGYTLQYSWRSPRIEEPGDSSPWGCKRAGHDSATK